MPFIIQKSKTLSAARQVQSNKNAAPNAQIKSIEERKRERQEFKLNEYKLDYQRAKIQLLQQIKQIYEQQNTYLQAVVQAQNDNIRLMSSIQFDNTEQTVLTQDKIVSQLHSELDGNQQLLAKLEYEQSQWQEQNYKLKDNIERLREMNRALIEQKKSQVEAKIKSRVNVRLLDSGGE